MMYQTHTIHSRLLPPLEAKSCTKTFKRHFPVYTKSFVFHCCQTRERNCCSALWVTPSSQRLLPFSFSRRQSIKREKFPSPPQKLLNGGFLREPLFFAHQNISPGGICSIKPPQIGLLRKEDRLTQITGKINKLQRSINKRQAEKNQTPAFQTN